MDRLTAEDRLTLWPDAIWPQDIGALLVLDGAGLVAPGGDFRADAARAAVVARLHRLPRLRQVIQTPRRGMGGPLWVDAPAFDLDDHVHVAAVPAPGGEAQVLAEVERIRHHPLDHTRPLWELWFLTGLADGRVGMFLRLHHVVSDGIAGLASLGELLDTAPDATVEPPPPWTPAPPPAAGTLARDALRTWSERVVHAIGSVRRPRSLARRATTAARGLGELVGAPPGPRTSLGGVIGPDRRLACVRAELGRVKELAHAHGATVNDVLLAAIAGGLRDLLRSRGATVDHLTVPVFVPVSLRRRGSDGPTGNLISQMVVPLPLGSDDPGYRLRAIAAETARRKADPHPSLGTMFGGRLLGGLMLRFVIRQQINVTTADLPGPPMPLWFAGARVREMFPLLNLLGNVTLGVGALSYAGGFDVMVVADADIHPDLDVFAAALGSRLT